MKFWSFIFIMFSFYDLKAQGFPEIPTNLKHKNCHIQITTNFKSGETKVRTRRFIFVEKAECENMKIILSDNMNPAKIKQVETKLEWRGK